MAGTKGKIEGKCLPGRQRTAGREGQEGEERNNMNYGSVQFSFSDSCGWFPCTYDCIMG